MLDDRLLNLVGRILSSREEKSLSLTDADILAMSSEFFARDKATSGDDVLSCGLYWLDHVISQLDRLIVDQLNAIIHHPRFQRLEASWRSLESLVDTSAGHKNVKIRLLDITWSEITKDVNRALEFDQCQLFQKIYSEEYDTPGGEPYGVLIADYEVSHKPNPSHRFDDIPTLERLAEIASAAFSPLLINASPELFGLEGRFDYLTHPISLESVFRESGYQGWHRLRNHPDSRFLGVTLPRILLRAPYTQCWNQYGGLVYDERRAIRSASDYLWGGANMAVAKVLIREFAEVGWFAHIRGAPRDQLSGGIVDQVVVDYYGVGPAEDDFKPSTDIIVTDQKERELAEQGFIAACQCYDLPLLAFHTMPSVFQNREFTSAQVSADERVASSLQYVLCGARFAHYIKVMMRDKIGSYTRASDCARMLQKWLNEYTVMQEDADWYLQSRYPLRRAMVEVHDNPEKPGEYWANILLQPHYQADSLVSELHLTTELTGVKGG